ncbi:MAG TPA: hypothetical protein VFH41_02840, partial [Bradyrhizobium sp.]|nr:hypothetical protein [Bradyrhizobium sp.]
DAAGGAGDGGSGSMDIGHRMSLQNQKAGARPAVSPKASGLAGCPGGAKAPPGLEGYFFFAFLAFLAFFAFFAFLAIASSFGFNGRKRDTRHARGGLYNLATASTTIPTDSQAAAPHCHVRVIVLSTVVRTFWCILCARALVSANPRLLSNVGNRGLRIGPRVNDASNGLRGLSLIRSKRASTPTRRVFTNSKPKRGFYGGGESPLSGAAAL